MADKKVDVKDQEAKVKEAEANMKEFSAELKELLVKYRVNIDPVNAAQEDGIVKPSLRFTIKDEE